LLFIIYSLNVVIYLKNIFFHNYFGTPVFLSTQIVNQTTFVIS